MGLLEHPLWSDLEPWVVIIPDGNTKRRKPRLRIEFRHDMPAELVDQAVHITTRCVACGAEIYPVRYRVPPKERGKKEAQGLYYSPCCPLNRSIGCSRGNAATDEYERFRKYLVRGV